MVRRSTLYYWLALLALLGLAAGYVRLRDLEGQYLEYQKSEAEVQRLRAQLKHRQDEVERLDRIVKSLATDPVEWEAAIRHNKGLVRPKDKVYRVESISE